MGRKKKAEGEKATKPGVSLDQECRSILSKILEWELAVENNDLSASQVIRKCMRIAWQKHYSEIFQAYEASLKGDDLALVNERQGNENPQSEAKNIFEPSETSDGGLQTRKTVNYRRGGKAK